MNRTQSFALASVLASCLASSPAMAYRLEDNLCFKPYMGFDAQLRYMSFVRGFGESNFKRFYPQGNIYVGFKFCDYLGIEGGYFSSTKVVNKGIFIEPNVLNLGVVSPDYIRADYTSQISGWHLGITGFIPFCSCCEVEGVLYTGLSNVKANFSEKVIYTLADVGPGFIRNDVPRTRSISQSKNILKLGCGFQQMITDYFGLRIMFNYENTSALNNVKNAAAAIKLKDSFSSSIGLLIKF